MTKEEDEKTVEKILERVRKVWGATRWVALSVMMTRTWTPRCRRRLVNSAALKAAMEPVTPSTSRCFSGFSRVDDMAVVLGERGLPHCAKGEKGKIG